MRRALLAIGCLAIAAATSQGTVILFDDFEGYADQTAMNSVWTPAVGSGAQLSTTQSFSPTHSAYIDLTARRSDRTFAETAGSDAEPLEWSVQFRDSAVGNARQYIQLLDYAPATNQLISIGVYNSVPGATVADLNTYYAARVAFAPGGGFTAAGWFLLNDPGVATRSQGWHELKVVFKDTVAEFYVDGTLGKTQQYTTSAGGTSFEQARIGSGVSTANGDAYYDDYLIEKVPEPAALMLLGLGTLLFVRRR